ncbi:MAG: iron complex outermembrane receptor protein [Alteromonadaceae bacterium]|jgi:iron complex outermembrane receptor protein
MSSNKFKKGVLASSIAMILAGGATPFAMAAEEAKKDKEIEVIQVTGIRGSLKAALNQKRFSDAVVDSISAEDIGKFPDRNIAESLQRISGVTIARNFAGEGGNVSIRGTNPELTLVTMNGNYLASTGWFSQTSASRSFDMDLLPAELVAGVDVYKSPMARLDEGGVGGTVSVRTRTPLQMDKNTLFLSAEIQNNSISDGNGNGATALYSWKNDEETIGFLGTFSTLKTVGRAHKAENYMDDGWAGAGIAEFNQERKRDAYDFTLEYAPTDELSMNLHFLQVDLNAANTNQNYLIVAGTDPEAFNARVTGATKFGPVNGNALNGTYAGDPLDESNSRNAETDTGVIAYEINYEGDSYTVNAKIGNTNATGGDGGNYQVPWTSTNANQSIEFDMSGHNEMLLSPNNTDPSNHAEYAMGAGTNVIAGYREDDETFGQVDLDFDVDLGPLTSIKTGVKLRAHEFTNYRDNWQFAEGFYLGKTKADFADGTFGHSGVGLTGNSPTNIARIDGAQIISFLNAAKTGETLRKNEYGVIKEDIFATYVQGDFSGDNWRGNLGVRYVKTDTSADYYLGDTLTTEESDYADWLPSFNLSMNLADDLILRMSAAKVISRPNYSFLNPAATVTETTRTIIRGSVNLDPYRATQFDIGLEWYFNEESLVSATFFSKDIRSFIIANANQTEIVYQSNDYTLIEPGQGLGGQLEGLEIQYQQQIGEFGWSANFTYTDGYGLQKSGDAIVETQLPGMSKFSYNLGGFYETDMFAARIGYTYRDEFIAPSTGIGGNTGWDAHGFLDANITWHATENFDVTLEAANILEETTTQRFTSEFDAMRLAADNGRNVYLKVSYRL